MTRVYIKYNPYTVESEIKINGEPVQSPNRLADYANERLQVWVDELIPILDEVCNEEEYEIAFYGTRLDYNDLTECVNDYCKTHEDIKVTYQFTEAKGSEDRFKELIALFRDMQENCPFEDLKTEQIRENFQSAISSEFEVSVIATMSSGKSTLINAILGRELMPSKNEACTATIARIKDVDAMDHFEAVYMNQDKRQLGHFDDLTLENMAQMNDNPETAYINIYGNIPNIDSRDVQLVLVDTPGPNNSRTEEHKNHTYRIIKEKTKPMVLYVLNATQLQTNDDRELLTAVSEAMKVGGKQSRDRFLFAVNKVDLFDPDKESVQGAIDNVKEYLKTFDIENPNIFPTSAELAKVIRMAACGQSLTSAQKRTLRDYDFFIEEEQLHLAEQATLSRDNLKKIRDMLQAARNAHDGEAEALIHTGVPAIELAINEYLEKYAYTAKVKAAVDTFRKKVEEKDMQAKMIASIQKDEAARARINAKLKEIQSLLAEGKTGAAFRQEIEQLDMMEEAKERIQKLRTKINQIAKNRSHNKKMTMIEATQMLWKLDRKIQELQSAVKTELESIIEDVINQGGSDIVKRYRTQMRSLISSGELEAGEYSGEGSFSILEASIPDADELIERYKYTESVDTGERERVKNYKHKWWDILGIFEPRKITRAIYTDVEVVDAEIVYNDYIDPIVTTFLQNLKNAEKTAREESARFKAFFLKELDALEDAMKKKVEENEILTRDRQSIERRMQEDRERVAWLTSFMNRLDQILTI